MQVNIHNYGIIEDLKVSLVPGLTVLVGQNGTGKSTFVDALYFAITGDTIDGRNVAERINWGALDGKAVVRLTTDDFTVERTIKSSGVSHNLKCGDTVLTKKADINAFLFSRWNLDNTGVLKDVFFAAQLHATDLFDATDAARLAMLAKVFGLDKLEQCRASILKVLAETPAPTISVEVLAAAEERVAGDESQVNTTKAAYYKAKLALEQDGFDEEAWKIASEVPLDTTANYHRESLKSAEEYLEKMVPVLEKEQHDLERYDAADNYLSWLKEQASRAETAARIEEELKQLSVGGPSIQSFNKALDEALRRRASLASEYKSLQQRSTDELKVCPLTQGPPCIELIRAHDPELVKSQLEEKRKSLKALDDDIEQLEALIADQTHTMERRASLLAAKKMHDEYIVPSVEIPEGLEGASIDDVQMFLNSFEDILTLRTDCDDLKKHVSEARAIAKQSKEWLEQHAGEKTQTKEEYDKLQAAYMQHWQLSKEVTDLAVQADAYEATLRKDKQMLDQLRAEKKRCELFQRKCELLRTVRELLSKGQLQRALLKSTIEQLNKEVLVCSKLLGFKYPLFITDTGAIRFIGEHESEADVKALSGGQKYAAAILLRLAFSRVIQSTLPFIVLDEPSTCLDVPSRQLLATLLTALHERNRKSGGYLVVPTHDELLVSATDQVVQIQ